MDAASIQAVATLVTAIGVSFVAVYTAITASRVSDAKKTIEVVKEHTLETKDVMIKQTETVEALKHQTNGLTAALVAATGKGEFAAGQIEGRLVEKHEQEERKSDAN